MTILLGVWIIYAVVKPKPLLLAVLFVLACINRETAILLLPAVVYGLSKQKGWMVAAAYGIGLAAWALLFQAFRHSYFDSNPGPWLEHHWADHQMILLSTYPMAFLAAIVGVGLLLWPALVGIRTKPRVLVVGLVCTFVPLVIASLPYGFLDETRALYDAYPFMALLALPTVLSVLLNASHHAVPTTQFGNPAQFEPSSEDVGTPGERTAAQA